MTFLDAYSLYGPDVEEIAKVIGEAPSAVDRQINSHMNKRRLGKRGKIQFAGYDRHEKQFGRSGGYLL